MQRLLGGGMRQQGPGLSTEPKGSCQWRCGVVNARLYSSGMANPLQYFNCHLLELTAVTETDRSFLLK